MAGNDVYLRSVPSDANRNDVRLYDPTQADSGGVQSGIGVSVGTSVALAAGASIAAAAGLSIGVATATGTGAATSAGTAVAAGAAAASATGAAIAAGAGQSVGLATPVSIGASTAEAAALAVGVASVTGAGSSTTVTPPTPEPSPSQTTGGGPNRFYTGKYRGEIRRTILRAQRELAQATDARKRKRRLRKVAKQLTRAVELRPTAQMVAVVPIDLRPLEIIRAEIVTIAATLDGRERDAQAKAEELTRLFDEYQDEVKRIERDEEERAIALILAIA